MCLSFPSEPIASFWYDQQHRRTGGKMQCRFCGAYGNKICVVLVDLVTSKSPWNLIILYCTIQQSFISRRLHFFRVWAERAAWAIFVRYVFSEAEALVALAYGTKGPGINPRAFQILFLFLGMRLFRKSWEPANLKLFGVWTFRSKFI